jgi:flagellar hook-length control protein FliK
MASVPPPSAPDATSVTLASDNTTAAGTAPPFGDAVANHVFSMISAGHQEATLQLQPPQLGELTVRVAIQGRDVSTWFGTAQPQVQLAVNQALDQLRADLAGAGLNLSGAWVGADASSMQQRSFDTGAAPTRRPSFVAPSVDQVSVGNADPSRGSSGVNIYV